MMKRGSSLSSRGKRSPARKGSALAVRDGVSISPTPEAVTAVTSILVSLLRNTMSSDIVELSLMSAQHEAEVSGVSPKVFDDVKGKILSFWKKKFVENPLHTMF